MCVYMRIYNYLYIYMKSSFPKRDKRQSKCWLCKANAKFGDHVLEIYMSMKSSFPKRHSKKWPCNANTNFKDCVLEKSFSHMYIWYICTYLWGAFFLSKTWSPNLALTVQHRFLDWCLRRFGKELFIYIDSYKYAYTHRWKDPFQNTIHELGIGITSQLFGMTFSAFTCINCWLLWSIWL